MDLAAQAGTVESTVFVNGLEVVVLKDTVIYVGLTNAPILRLMSNARLSARLKSTASPNFNASPSANKVSNLASNAARSLPPLVTRTLTPPTATPSCVHTTSRSSSAAGTRSSGAAQCRWRWRPAGKSSLICSSRCRITWYLAPTISSNRREADERPSAYRMTLLVDRRARSSHRLCLALPASSTY
jgi:hypothetical protein